MPLLTPLPSSQYTYKNDLRYYGISPNNTEQSVQLQAAINAANAQGITSLFVPPGGASNPILLDRSNSIIVPDGMHIHGVRGQSVFKGVGTIPNQYSFPLVGASMFCVGNPSTGQRYGTQTGRVVSGTGATFNLTVTSSAVTAATVVSGGTGFKVGDWIYVGYSTTLLVTAVSTHRGPVTTVSIYAGGNWGATTPANPVSQTGSLGMALYDRILDPVTFASRVAFSNIVLDGDYPTVQLTGTQFYGGINARGILEASAIGVEVKNFPNTGIWFTDVKRGTMLDCAAYNCGWNGVFGGTRNGFSNTGLYVTTNTTLNTDQWMFSRNKCISIGDVGSQFAYVGGAQIDGNSYLGCGTIAIEGEGSGYAVLDNFANNGGILIPADAKISNNYINGTMLDGRLATDRTSSANYVSSIGLDGISWNCGNEGRIEISKNRIFNTQRYGIACNQNDNGTSIIEDNELDTVNSATGTVRLQAINTNCEKIIIDNNKIRNLAGGPGILISNKGLEIDITNNKFTSMGGGGNPCVLIQQYRSRTSTRWNISSNKFASFYAEAIKIDMTGANTMTVRSIVMNDNICMDGNRNNTGASYIRCQTSSGGTLNFNTFESNNNTAVEGTLYSASTPTISINITNTVAPLLVQVARNKLPQMTSKYSITMSVAATAIDYTGNL